MNDTRDRNRSVRIANGDPGLGEAKNGMAGRRQSSERTVGMGPLVIAWTALFGLLTACTAPKAPPGYGPESLERPQWVDQLSERVADVPPAPPTGEGQLLTPTDGRSPLGAAALRGQPRDLTGRLSERLVVEDAPYAERFALGVVQDEDYFVPPSTLERMYRGLPSVEDGRALRQFGYGYFAPNPERAESADPLAAVAPDHIVAPGDELLITLSGSLEGRHELVVDREGVVAVPGVGTVPVAGRRYGELQALLTDAVRSRGKRRAFELDVSIGKLRPFRVQVVGHVLRPGAIEVPGRASVLTALERAGGPLASGSLRRVELRRDGESLAEIDLYGFLLRGDVTGLEILRPDDVLVVPPIGPTVGVAGAVLRPAIYEVGRAGANVGEALELAGGLTPFAYTQSVQLEQPSGGRRETVKVDLDPAGLVRALRPGALLMIDEVDAEGQPMLEVRGAISRAGRYPYKQGIRLSELVRMADGVTVEAYLPQAIISRVVGQPSILSDVPERTAVATTRRVLIVNLGKALAGDREQDVVLQPFDHVTIRTPEEAAIAPAVTVLGAVRKPGQYELTAGLRVSDLIALAGNLKSNVYYDEAELIRRSYDEVEKQLVTTRYRFDLGKALRGEVDPLLVDRDQIVVRALRDAAVRVQVTGEVRFPGSYVFPQGARISELIAAAGGPIDGADLRAAVFARESVKKMQRERFRHLRERTRIIYENALEEMVKDGWAKEGAAAKIALEQTKRLLGRLETHQATGRVVIPFTRRDFPNSVHDLRLEDGDVLRIPPRQETLAILGHVFNPGSFVAEAGVTVQSLVDRAGGLTEDGDQTRLYVIRADGVVHGLRQKHGRIASGTELLPGDAVLVPRRPVERSVGSRIADALHMARRMAETAFVLGRLGDGSDLNYTSVYSESNDQPLGLPTLINDFK